MAKIFVVAHKPVYIPDTSLLVPISADSIKGINIADKSGYSELRAHYSVWKNEPLETEVVGFFQFRRYLDFSMALSNEKDMPPYRVKRLPNENDYRTEVLYEYMEHAQVIAPIPEYTGVSVKARYQYAKGHNVADLNCIYDIIKCNYNSFTEAMVQYLNGDVEYYGNLYIMKRQIFDEYCSWLFSVLDIFDTENALVLPRTQGYLAERLFGIWFTKAKLEGKFNCKLLPRVHFWGYDDASHNLKKEIVLNRIIPPGGNLKAALRKLNLQRMRD